MAVNETLSSEAHAKGAICYIPFAGWIISLFFILTEREDRYVRFNALQSLMLLFLYVATRIVLSLLAGVLANIELAMIPIRLVELLVPYAYILASLLLIYKTFIGEKVLLPKIGPAAEEQV